jgi:hypothetical protein
MCGFLHGKPHAVRWHHQAPQEIRVRSTPIAKPLSLAEYVRRLVARDLARPETAIAVDRIFDLGSSGGVDIAMDKGSMIAEAFQAKRRKTQRR